MNKDPSTLIHSYKRRQQIGPFILWGLVIILVFAGIILLFSWLSQSDSPVMGLFATQTPTSTITPSPTETATPTDVPTETATPTITASPTAASPFTYIVQDGDSLAAISDKFNLGDKGIPLILLLNPLTSDGKGIDPTTQIVYPGEEIIVPNPDMELPTATPIPADVLPGTKTTYTIQAGDTLASIASLFNSTVEDILTQNDITDANKIQVGEQLTVRINLVTPTPAPKPTITQGPSPTPPSPYTPTPPGGLTLTPTATATQ